MTCLAVGGALASCTLASPANDLFDPEGIERVGDLDGSIQRIVVAGNYAVYNQSGRGLWRINLRTGERELLASGAGVGGLASNGVDTFSWCVERGGGAWFAVGAGAPSRVVGSSECASTALRGATLVYAARAELAFVETGQGTVIRTEDLTRYGQSITTVAFDDDGLVYLGGPFGLARRCIVTDNNCTAGYCRLVSRPVSTPLAIVGTGGGARAISFEAAGLAQIASASGPGTQCCAPSNTACANDPLIAVRGADAPGTHAVFAGRLFGATEGALRWLRTFADPGGDTRIAGAPLGTTHLAFAPEHVYFVVDGKLLRRRLTLLP
jgi:hypothetical protein